VFGNSARPSDSQCSRRSETEHALKLNTAFHTVNTDDSGHQQTGTRVPSILLNLDPMKNFPGPVQAHECLKINKNWHYLDIQNVVHCKKIQHEAKCGR